MGGHRVLVLAVQLPLTRAEQLKLRPGGDEPFNGVEHLLKVGVIGSHQRDADHGPAMLVLQSGLGRRDLEPPLQFGHQWAHQ